ncbi:hypothetical protein [Paenibacillus sp. IHBB 10380]|uniref:hypothetical protein n=1 Tax=Paenibacillus sp. IHBB 10380 TaxID=1566358 RepID=UPI0005CFEC8C|nr:hypothetical protein [Paenibacillus sp. IHBB 10380]AJS61231.1 hypothetical protein UB51_25490 [Paenibacillus sp. IHBB 10380]
MRRFIGVMLLLVLIVVVGCTPATRISTDQVKAFVKDVKNSKNFVKDMDVQFRPTQIEFIYTLNENIDETDRIDLLSDTKQLVNSEEFGQEVIQEDYLKKYESGGYPDIAIIFDANDDGEYDYQYTSSYDQDELNTTDEPSYLEWYYHQDMNATGEPISFK